MDIIDFMSCNNIEIKAKLLVSTVKDKINLSLKLINKEYKQKDLLEEIIIFIDLFFVEGFKTDSRTLSRIGFFPTTEAQIELDLSIQQTLMGNYKSSIDHMRRGLELSILSIYLSNSKIDASVSRKWLTSQKDTPSFSQDMINTIITLNKFKQFNKSFKWSKKIKNLYWTLCDYVHVKGPKKGIRELNKGSSTSFAGSMLWPINLDSLIFVLDLYITVVRQLAISLCLYNPILLIGLPIDAKFGLNPPTGGFYNEGQSEAIRKLIPIKYELFFKRLIQNDDEVKDLLYWINTFPDLTEKQLKEQADNFEKMLKR